MVSSQFEREMVEGGAARVHGVSHREHAQQPEQQPDAHPELFPSRLTVGTVAALKRHRQHPFLRSGRVFRGADLGGVYLSRLPPPSFTRYFRLDLSILLSSLVFALAHFSTERLIPLTFLGMLMCVVYIRSKNILAPIILHSLWNAFAFVELIVKPDVIVKWVANMLGYGI